MQLSGHVLKNTLKGTLFDSIVPLLANVHAGVMTSLLQCALVYR